MIDRLLEEYRNGLKTALSDAQAAGDVPDVSAASAVEPFVELPKGAAHGDLASNFALVLGRALRRPPRQVAEAIVRHYPMAGGFVERLEVAGPGFLNAFFRPSWRALALRRVLDEGEEYGQSARPDTASVLVEFVSSNPTGPLNVVSARAAAVGDSLCNLLAAAGHRVHREYYVNDAGARMEALGRSVIARGRQALGLIGPDEFPEDGYPGEDVAEVARLLLAETPRWIEDQRVDEASAYAVAHFLRSIRATLSRYRVQFDRFVSEEALHQEGAVARVVEHLTAVNPNAVQEDEGALWLDTTILGDDKRRVLRRSDGTYTYFTADLAYHENKLARGFAHLIDFVGPDHHGYVARMQAAMTLLGHPADCLEIRLIQFVRLVKDGEAVKMSKRLGSYITLDEVLDDVGVDAARFFLVSRHPDSPLDFDLTLAKAEVDENPVFYVQYAHARIQSILRHVTGAAEDADLSLLVEPEEVALIRLLSELPLEIAVAADLREPHRMARYTLDLATAFHTFYNRCRVLGVAPELQAARLLLCRAVAICLRRSLGLIGVSAPESMARREPEQE